MRIDFSALETSAAGERAHTVQRQDSDAPRAAYLAAVLTGVGGFVSATFGFVFFAGTLEAKAGLYRPGLAATYAAIAAFALLLGVLAIVAVVLWRKRHIRPVPSLESRLPAFSLANGLAFVDEKAVQLPGSLFSPPAVTGASPAGVYGVRGFREVSGRRFYIGDSSKVNNDPMAPKLNRPFVAIELERSLPRIVLAPRGIDPMFDLDKTQRLSLEGDFDKYFTLYCPVGYQADALVVFTPDVMAAMVDGAQGWVAEIADDWLFFYRSGSGFDTATVDDYRRAFELVAAVAPEVVQQSAHYSDDRVGNRAVDRIAEGGRSLRAAQAWWTPLAVVGLLLTLVAPVAIGFVGVLH
ncbi:MAG: hypothetical protein ABJA94_11540 [Rhodoglobus sp.]